MEGDYKIRAHQKAGILSGSFGYNSAQRDLVRDIYRTSRKKIVIVAGPGSLCDICPRNAGSEYYDPDQPTCDPTGPELEDLDFRVLNGT